MPVESLTHEELTCLRRLGRQADDGQQVCSQGVLDRLVIKGLVEQRPLLVLPIQPQRYGYQLTPAGRALLTAAEEP